MYKWEYYTLMSKTSHPEELNKLGEEGWEAFTVLPIMAARSAFAPPEPAFVFVFKRQLPMVSLHA